MMRKITNLFKSPALKNALIVLALAFLSVVEFVIAAVPIDDFWKKIIATCYIVATYFLFLIVGTPKTGRNIGFSNISITSFITWCIIVPIIIGALVAMLISETIYKDNTNSVGFWSMAICITVFSFVWFLMKLYKREDTTSRLDLFSTVWIAAVTILTTLYDLDEIRGALVFLLAMYFILQILIKAQICRIQEESSNLE